MTLVNKKGKKDRSNAAIPLSLGEGKALIKKTVLV